MARGASPPRVYSLEWVVDVLQQAGLLDDAQRRDVEVRSSQQRARVLQQRTGGQPRANYIVSPGELIASFGIKLADGTELDEDRVAAAVARAAGFPYRKIDPLKLDMGLITQTLSRPFALRHVVLPLERDDLGRLTVAMENPFDPEATENLERISPQGLRVVVSSKLDILKAITEVYGFRQSVESAARDEQRQGISDFEQLVRLRNVGDIEATDKHIVNAVDFLLSYAFDQRASDIHIEPRRGDSQVRLRIDGVLHDVHTIPRAVHPAIASRIKMLGRMDIAEKRRPQDGRIKMQMDDKEVELRLSTLPVAFGEKLVIRIFDPGKLLQDLTDLGFEGPGHATFDRWLRRPHGMILITGPTGSGKTTTLYTALKVLADESVNITTIEDPIEMVTDRFNQVAVQSAIGVTFAAALRTILRQDPDIIMVGEIRDAETAQMAVQAALTGHLVFSTLHTNTAAGAVTRLMDLDVPRYLISSVLVGTLAQRLVRRVCRDCHRIEPISADQVWALGLSEGESKVLTRLATAQGCVKCRGTGYVGRIGIFEMFDIGAGLAPLVAGEATEQELHDAARRLGMVTLRESALQRLAQGYTTFEEVMRVMGQA